MVGKRHCEWLFAQSVPAGSKDVAERIAPVTDRNRNKDDVDIGTLLDPGEYASATTHALEAPRPRFVPVANPRDRGAGEVTKNRHVVDLCNASGSEDPDADHVPDAPQDRACRTAGIRILWYTVSTRR